MMKQLLLGSDDLETFQSHLEHPSNVQRPTEQKSRVSDKVERNRCVSLALLILKVLQFSCFFCFSGIGASLVHVNAFYTARSMNDERRAIAL
jgi:hypothetical protein